MGRDKIIEIVGRDQDLVDCSEIPIAYPGGIQNFAFVAGFQRATGKLLFFSQNYRQWLLHPVNQLGVPENIESLLGAELWSFVDSLLGSSRERGIAAEVPKKLMICNDDQKIFLTPLQSGDAIYLEFERAWVAKHNASEAQLMASNFSKIEYLSSDAFFQALTDVCYSVCPSERILLYRFDEEWNGEVVAETSQESKKRFLNHWFPQSDIPKQVRDQYLSQPVRVICDVTATTVSLRSIDELPPEQIDLSCFASRGLSQVHREYLLNMGVHSACSIAVMAAGKLWGLIAIHHSCPRVIPSNTRAMLLGLGLLAGNRIAEMSSQDCSQSLIQGLGTLSELQKLAGQRMWDMELAKQLISSDSVLLIKETEVLDSAGEPLNSTEVSEICQVVNELRSRSVTGLFEANRVNEEEFASSKLSFSGIMGFSWETAGRTCSMVWLRKPILEKRLWGGRPMKTLGDRPGQGRIQPRKSFETWVQEQRDAATPWSSNERQLAEIYSQALSVRY